MPAKKIKVFKKTRKLTLPITATNGGGTQKTPKEDPGEKEADQAEVLQKATQELHANTYLDFLDSVYDSIFITDMQGTIQKTNARAEEKMRAFRNDFKGRQVTDLIVGADQALIELLRDPNHSRKFTVLQAECIREDKTRFRAEIVASRLLGAESTRLCFSIREIKQRDDEAKEAKDSRNSVNADILMLRKLVDEFTDPVQILLCLTDREGEPELKPHLTRIMQVLRRLRAMAEGEDPEEVRDEAVALEPAAGDHVLIVEHDATVGRLLAEALGDHFPQTNIETALTGLAALDVFGQHHHGLVILDAGLMKQNPTPFEGMQKLCADRKWEMPPVVFCVSVETASVVEGFVGDHSPHCSLRKPFETSALVRLVRDKLPGLRSTPRAVKRPEPTAGKPTAKDKPMRLRV